MSKSDYEADVKDRILNVAAELFVKKGYSGTSIRDIATAAKANVAHINYYFGSKYKLFERIFDEAFDMQLDRVFETLNADMPFFEMVETWIDIYFEILTENPQIAIFILNEINQGHKSLVEKIKKRDPERILIRLSERMAEEVEKGSIKDVPVVDFGLNVLSMCVFPFIFKGLAMKVADKSNAEIDIILKEHKKYVVDFVFRGLKY